MLFRSVPDAIARVVGGEVGWLPIPIRPADRLCMSCISYMFPHTNRDTEVPVVRTSPWVSTRTIIDCLEPLRQSGVYPGLSSLKGYSK